MKNYDLVRERRPQVSTHSRRLIERHELHAYDPGSGSRLTLQEFETHELGLRDVGVAERKRLAAKGAAMPHGGFPIASAGDLKNAIKAFGRAGNKAATKAHIKKMARKLGRTDMLPANW